MHKCKVEAHIRGREWGVNLGPGGFYDLDVEIAPGVTLRDVTEPEWFEEVGSEE